MPSSRNFLIIDNNADSRFLLVKTLLRKFPLAVLHETQDAATAAAMAKAGKLDAIIAHRATDVDGVALVRLVRQANSTVPLVMVSGLDRASQAIEAGASAFLSYDAWLRIGSVVAELLERSPGSPRPPDSDATSPAGRGSVG